MLRTLMFAFALLISSATLQPALAGNVVELENGQFILEEDLPQIKRHHDVTVSDAAAAYPDAWRKALETGEDVPIETTIERTSADGITGLWRYQKIIHAREAVVYDRSNGNIDVVDRAMESVWQQYNYLPFVWIVGVAMMLLPHRLVHRKISGSVAFFAGIITTLTSIIFSDVGPVIGIALFAVISIGFFIVMIIDFARVDEYTFHNVEGRGVTTAPYIAIMVLTVSIPVW